MVKPISTDAEFFDSMMNIGFVREQCQSASQDSFFDNSINSFDAPTKMVTFGLLMRARNAAKTGSRSKRDEPSLIQIYMGDLVGKVEFEGKPTSYETFSHQLYGEHTLSYGKFNRLNDYTKVTRMLE